MRKYLRRRYCRRHGHDRGGWRPTMTIFVQGRRCARCGPAQTRWPFDDIPKDGA